MRVVVAGAGEVGRHLAQGLAQQDHDVVMIDRRADALAAVEESLDVRGVAGDVAWRDVLRRGEVHRADAFIAVTGSDDANMLSAALARSMGARVAVARVDDPGFFVQPGASERGLLGVDHVLCSPRLTCSALLTMVMAAAAPLARTFAAGRLQVVGWRVRPTDAVSGREPGSLRLQPQCWLGAVGRDGFVRRPEEVGRIEPGDVLVLSGDPAAVATSCDALGSRAAGGRFVVTGGSTVGALIAGLLAARGFRVELVELDRARAQELAQQLPGVRILRGDATDLEFLRDIRLEDAAGVIAATWHDEVNLLTTMLVRQLERPGRPAPQTWAAVTRPGYADLCRQVGIGGTASTFEVLARAVLEAIRPAGLVDATAIPGTAWQAGHLRLPDALPDGLQLADLPLPPTLFPLSLLRDTEVAEALPEAPLSGGEDLLVAGPAAELKRAEAALRGIVSGPR
jgi:trk system potassium uptake protein TrkA